MLMLMMAYGAASFPPAGLNLGCLLDVMSVVDETVIFTYAVAATKVTVNPA